MTNLSEQPVYMRAKPNSECLEIPFPVCVVGSPGMKGAGDTLECLKDEPSDTLALLAVKEDLTNLSRLYSHRSSSNQAKFVLQRYSKMGGNLQIILTRIDFY